MTSTVSRFAVLGLLAFAVASSTIAYAQSVLADAGRGAPPRVLDERLRLELVAEAPQIVTPIAMTFDVLGRLLVVESHTHQRPTDYAGPPADRIRLLEDENGDGRADRFSTFYEGTSATMSLMTYVDGSIYVATRMEIFRLRDADGDGEADERQPIVHLETTGDYPHNGLGGLTHDAAGRIYFGMGENLGAAYRLLGSDGREMSGQAEGGNVFRCDASGRGLTKVATGFWNPFGLCFDDQGRLFAVDNDPDGRPPCRLLQVVEGADYGYQFRYGRSGQHPLQAWDGELPGVLPMVAGTGEAPSSVLADHGRLWVTSWGDHRIERFQLRPRGASFQATSEFVVQGDQFFRPVDFALAPDGSLYFSDWVLRDYPVHGQGRIWRLVWNDQADQAAKENFPPMDEDELRAAELRRDPDLASLDDPDPFIHQAAAWGFSRSPQLDLISWTGLKSERERLGLLEAMKLRKEAPREETMRQAFRDPSPEVRLFAVRWVAGQSLHAYRDSIAELLQSKPMTLSLFQAIAAALHWLDYGQVPGDRDFHDQLLIDALLDESAANDIRILALRLLPPEHEQLSLERLRKWLDESSAEFAAEVVRTLAMRRDADSLQLLADIAAGPHFSEVQRADAVMGLGAAAEQYREVLTELATIDSRPIREEAVRSLRGASSATQTKTPAEVIPAADLDAWWRQVGEGGDADAGRRVFFASQGASCARCHRFQGRGADVGPDLTDVGRRTDRRRLLESILQPSREVAPRYSPWSLVTDDGLVHVGLAAPQPYSGDDPDPRETFIANDGSVFELPTKSIEFREQISTSIMPDGLEQLIGVDEMRDLLAFLTQAR